MQKNWYKQSLFHKWHKLLFILVIVLAIFLRFWGIYPSYPPYHSDEGMSYSQGIYIIKENNLDANGYSVRLGYPYLIPYINAFFFKFLFIPLSWSKFFYSNLTKIADGVIHLPLAQTDINRIFQLEIIGNREIYVLTWGRVLAATFGVGVVILVYILGRELFNRKTGLISAFLVGVNYREVLNSHLDLPDIYNAFFLLLSLIFSYRLISKRQRSDFLLAGIFVGLSFSTRFNLYAIVGFVAAFVIASFVNKDKFKDIVFSSKVFIAAFVGMFIFILINPFHFIHLEEAIETISYESKKYGAGRFAVSLFPFWYIFNFAIGKFTVLVGVVGILLMLFRKRIQFLFLFSITLFFFYFVTYVTNGGYYTRNFVTIIPVLLIFPGYFLSLLLDPKNKYKILGIGFFIILSAILFGENFSKASVIGESYSKPWNYEILGTWLKSNIPNGSIVAAHSSVPLPDYVVTRVPYEPVIAFSLPEFIEEKAQFSVSNFDWISNDYYGWMNDVNSRVWGKPLSTLMQQYSALSTYELADYSIYSIVKPALAPESNFFVSKIPSFSIRNKALKYKFTDISGSWKSDPIDLSGYGGLYITGNFKNGFIYITFYKTKSDTSDITKMITARVSARNMTQSFSQKEIISDIPHDAKWAVIGFSNYSVEDFAAKEIDFYDASVEVNMAGYQVHRSIFDNDIIFPNSQGNL